MDLTRLLLLLAVAGVAVTLLVAPGVWFMDERRRVRRGLKVILKGDAHGWLVAGGRGRGMGFNFTHDTVAVAWDMGAWGLCYPLSALLGAEAIADGVVVARTHRGETRRALDNLGGAESRVALRLVFDDVAHPEFVLDLWLPQDAQRRGAYSPTEALEECNRWLARIEAMLKRPAASKPLVVSTSPPMPPDAPFAVPRNDVTDDEEPAV